MPLKESGEFVWFLAYEHKNGTDESCFDSEKSALVEARRIMEEYVEDWGREDGEEEEMRKLITKDVREAMDQWSDYTGENEYLRLEHKTIWTYVDNIERMRKAVESAQDSS